MVELTVPWEIIQNKIFLLRGKKVIFDKDLAVFYNGVNAGQYNPEGPPKYRKIPRQGR